MPPTLNRENMVLGLNIRRASGSQRAAKFKACRKFSLNVVSGIVHQKTHQRFFVHATLEELKNATITGHFEFVSIVFYPHENEKPAFSYILLVFVTDKV